MTSKQRAYLRKLAHSIDPIFQIGKNGTTPEVVKSIEEALDARELIKITVLKNCMEDMAYIAEAISERSHSQIVQIMGRRITLYKARKKDPEIILPKA